MNKICTTIEQSKKLMELGIDVNTADMFYLRADIALGEIECYPNVLHREDVGDDIPAWSLAALLGLIHNNSYILRNTSVETNRYNIWTIQRKSPVWCKTPLDAAFEMVCWLLENKKL